MAYVSLTSQDDMLANVQFYYATHINFAYGTGATKWLSTASSCYACIKRVYRKAIQAA
ncbi:hypothetical protein [Campylobacter sp. 19-13652]|uniref:hypothetical protein n=1 Tax=Campylobacter sp. 19-13652 TaxID=2840180 RepID=UPI001C841857|nr:hypothetical protein [Campylobacter sp. 19-13652]